jgi:hypothetical protein
MVSLLRLPRQIGRPRQGHQPPAGPRLRRTEDQAHAPLFGVRLAHSHRAGVGVEVLPLKCGGLAPSTLANVATRTGSGTAPG